MTDLLNKLPVKGEVWEHTKTGKRYVIEGSAFNAITDKIDVRYAPLYACEYQHFTRQIIGHEKAFLSNNEDGQPRYTKIEMTKPAYSLEDQSETDADMEVHLALKAAGLL